MAEQTLETTTAPKTTPSSGNNSSDDLKVKIANENDYVIGNFINEKLALIDENNNSNTKFGMKIVTYFIPKFNKGSDFYKAENAINLPYSSMVKEIVLEDTLDSIGLRGHIDVVNEGGVLEGVVERHNLFYLVINITEFVTADKSLKYEPYIFEIESVSQVTNNFRSGSRTLRFHLIDVMTSILKSHSIASFIRFSGTEVTKIKNYKLLFQKIVEYVKKYIKINTDNSLEYKKDILFDDKMLFKGKDKINGYDDDTDMSSLVNFSFNKVERNASIWEALQVFLTDCVTSIKMTDVLKASFENIGDVLIPFFFKEEYGDIHGVYNSFWHNSDDKPSTSQKPAPAQQPAPAAPVTQPAQPQPDPNQPATVDETSPTQPEETLESTVAANVAQDGVTTQTSGSELPTIKGKDLPVLINCNYGGNSVGLVYRPITMRDFYMPFYLCFSNSNPCVFQDINEGKTGIISIEPKINDNLQSLKFTTIDKKQVDKRWKNVVFIDTKNSSTNSTMIFFDWFYRFFLKVFLNSEKMGGNRRYISNVIPDFYLFQLVNGVGGAENGNNVTFNNIFDEMNAYTVATETKDTVNEALREMGKNIASLVLLNDSYSFSLRGSIRRRPNEIIRLNVGELINGGELQIPIFTNLNQENCLYVYVRKVTHIFQGDEYINKIVTSKICEGY